MKYNLDRFIKAQKENFELAYSEIKQGHKYSHWVWYIFPQIKGLGYSDKAIYFSVESIDEAKSYMNNEYLSNNLINITKALLELKSNDPIEVMGHPDNLKLNSCMTLFYKATNNQLFLDVINKYYNGKLDDKTIELLKNS